MEIRYEKKGPIAIFTLDHPPVNVWTPKLHRDFYNILQEFLGDNDVRVGILTGAGDRSFSAGDDIKTSRPKRTISERIMMHLQDGNKDYPLEYPGWEEKIPRINRYKPIIAAVNGYCLGQGMIYLLTLTDIRIASSNAQFGLPEIAYGMGGAGGMTWLNRQIPHTLAMWMLLTGKKLSAEEALIHHLVNEVVEKKDLMNRAQEIANIIAEHPPLAVRVEMESYYRGMEMSRQDAFAFSSHLYHLQRVIFPEPPDPSKYKGG